MQLSIMCGTYQIVMDLYGPGMDNFTVSRLKWRLKAIETDSSRLNSAPNGELSHAHVYVYLSPSSSSFSSFFFRREEEEDYIKLAEKVHMINKLHVLLSAVRLESHPK